MTPEKRAEIKKKMEDILDKITIADRQRQALEESLLKTLPIKIGEKISVIDAKSGEHIRFAFVYKISVSPPNENRGARLDFRLNKCKKDGRKSEQEDWLRHGLEQITKIY